MPAQHLRPTPHLWSPGMRVFMANAPYRVLATHVGCFLEDGDYHEVLIAPEVEGAGALWINADRAVIDREDPTTRRLLECPTPNDAPHGGCESSSGGPNSDFRSPSSSSSISSSPFSSDNSLDVEAILERLQGSMSGHVSDMGWKLLTHAERDILDLVAEVKRLRGRR